MTASPEFRESREDKSGQKSFSALENDNGGVHYNMDICHVKKEGIKGA